MLKSDLEPNNNNIPLDAPFLAELDVKFVYTFSDRESLISQSSLTESFDFPSK